MGRVVGPPRRAHLRAFSERASGAFLELHLHYMYFLTYASFLTKMEAVQWLLFDTRPTERLAP